MLILPRRNPLAYPAGVAAGFDPNHAASRGVVRFSGVAKDGSFVDVRNGMSATIATSSKSSINSIIGPISTKASYFSGAANSDKRFILAAIFSPQATDGFDREILKTSSTAATGVTLRNSAALLKSARPALDVPGVATFRAPETPTFGPIFAGVYSQPSSSLDSFFVLADLRTGRVYTHKFTSYSYGVAASDGTFVVGDDNSVGDQFGIAAAMYGNGSITLQEMIAWASDPWSFWYPQSKAASLLVATGSSAPSLTAEDLACGGPVLGAPALTQKHAMVAAPLAASAVAIGAPALAQRHSLAATGLAVASPALGAPTLSGRAALAAAGIAVGQPSFGTPVLKQVHALAAQAFAAGAPAMAEPAVVQLHKLVASGLTVGSPQFGDVFIPMDAVAVAADLVVGSPVLGTPTLKQIQEAVSWIVGRRAPPINLTGRL